MTVTTEPARNAASSGDPKTPAAPRLAGLDGLRAIAVATVIGYHFLPDQVVGGYVGVDVFFVISGFLITGLLVRERRMSGRISLPRFWARRARRLIPALVLLVALCGAAAFYIGGILGRTDVLVGLGSQVLGAGTFSSNWLFIAGHADYFDATTLELFRNLWSLAVEEQFYLLWPALLLLVLFLRKRAVRVVVVLAIAVASGAAMWLLAEDGTTRVYYGTDTHSFGLAIGAALALLLESRFVGEVRSRRGPRIVLAILGTLAVVGIIAVAALLPAADPRTVRGGLAVVTLLTAIAIAGAVSGSAWLGRGLDVLPVRWVGERSYGLYLWHWPVLVLLAASLPFGAPWWLAPAAATVVTVAAATLSYRFVEHPIRVNGFLGAASSLAARRPAFRVAAGAACITLLGATVLAGAAIVQDPGKGDAQLAIEQGQQAIEHESKAPAEPVPEEPPPPPSGDQITAVGDSVMLAAAPELQAAFPGIAIDAIVSRQMWQAKDVVQGLVDSGAMRPILVIGLGTNGSIQADTLDQIETIVGDETLIVVVNVQAPRGWVPGVNATLAEFARHERNVELANWHDAIQPRLDVLAGDQVHPGTTGGQIYVGALSDALQRLAELPPRVDNNRYDQLSRPV